MSKIAELANDLAVPVKTTRHSTYATELENFRIVAADGLRAKFIGTLLRFRKGIWIYGEAKRELKRGTRLVAVMTEARRGYVRWQDKKATAHVIGRIADGFMMPERQTLGDNDPASWPIGPDGRPQDPWVPTLYLPLASSDGDQFFTFATSSDGGGQAVYQLINRYASLGQKNPGQFPIVALDVDSYESRKFSTTVFVPVFSIVGWTGRQSLALISKNAELPEPTAELATNDDMDDEIPY